MAEAYVMSEADIAARDAAVEARVRTQVAAEIAEALQTEIDWQREQYGDGKDRAALGRLIGMEDALSAVRRITAEAPSGTVGTDNQKSGS